MRQSAETDAKEILPEHKGELLLCAGTEIAQRGCGVSLAEDTPEPSGHNPMPCVLGCPCLCREVAPEDPLLSLQPDPTCPLKSIYVTEVQFISGTCQNGPNHLLQ